MLLCSSVFSASLFLYLHMLQHYHCFICLFILPHIYQFLFTVPCLLLIPSLQFQFPSSWSISSSSYFSKSLLLLNFLRFIFFWKCPYSTLKKKKKRVEVHLINISWGTNSPPCGNWWLTFMAFHFFASTIFLLLVSEHMFSRYCLFLWASMCCVL